MNSAQDSSTIRKPVIHHVHELQKRLIWSVLAVIAGTALAYSVNGFLLAAIQRPLGQTLYYTSPLGGFSFLLKLSLAVGFVIALPVVLYQAFSFLAPLLKKHHKLTVLAFAIWSFDLAYCGLAFAYFISLPSALHFLSQFGGSTVQSLITVDEYFSFALAYLAGFAIMFQVPLIILFVNRIKPLKPKKMFGAQRYVILFSFIAAAILTPTPDPMNQTIMALPAIALYQVGIVLVWLANRERNKAAARVQTNTHIEQRQNHAKAVHTRQQQKPRPIIERPIPVLAATIPQQSAPGPTTTVIAPIPDPVLARRTSRQSIDGFITRVPQTGPVVRSLGNGLSVPPAINNT